MIAGDFNSAVEPFQNLKTILRKGDSTFRRVRKIGRNKGKVESRTDHI